MVSKSVLAACLILTGIVNIVAGSDQEQWLQAQAYYHQQDFASAAKALQAITHKTAPVWYNLANCAYQLKDYLTALALWRRAQTLELQALSYTGPIYCAAAQQILNARAVLATSNYRFDATRAQAFGLSAFAAPVVNSLASPVSPVIQPGDSDRDGQTGAAIVTASRRLVHVILARWQLVWQQTPLLIWQLLFLLSWLSCSYLLYRASYRGWQWVGWAQFRQNMPRSKLYLSLFLLLSAGWLGYTVDTKWQFNRVQWGLITVNSAQLYLGPSLDYPRLATTLPRATFVEILAEAPQNWYAVQVAERSITGWVTAGDIVRC